MRDDAEALMAKALDLKLFNPVTATVLRERKYPAPVMLIESLLARGERAMISGPQKVPASARVWFLDAEMGEQAFWHRLDRVLRAYNLPASTTDNILYESIRGRGLDLRDHGEALAGCAFRHGVDLVIIDPITDATSIDENSSQQFGAALRAIQDGLAEVGIASLIVHHARKGADHGLRGGENARGSGKAGERQDVTMQSFPLRDQPPRIRIEAQCRNREWLTPITAELTEVGALVAVAGGDTPGDLDRKVRDADRLYAALADGQWHLNKDVVEKLRITESRMSRLTSTLPGIEKREGPDDRRKRELRFVGRPPGAQQ